MFVIVFFLNTEFFLFFPQHPHTPLSLTKIILSVVSKRESLQIRITFKLLLGKINSSFFSLSLSLFYIYPKYWGTLTPYHVGPHI